MVIRSIGFTTTLTSIRYRSAQIFDYLLLVAQNSQLCQDDLDGVVDSVGFLLTEDEQSFWTDD